MEMTLKFYRITERMPERYEYTVNSGELLVKVKGMRFFKYARYNFEEKEWEDASDWNDWHGWGKLKNVEMWALIPEVWLVNDHK